jgi:hypothetical protein
VSATTATPRFDDPGSRGVFVVGAIAAVLTTASVAAIVVQGSPDVACALAFSAFVAVGQFMALTLPGEREVAPVAMAAGLAFALATNFAGRPLHYQAFEVTAFFAIASLVGVLPRVFVGRTPRIDALSIRVITVAVTASAFRGSRIHAAVDRLSPTALALVMVSLVICALLFEAVLSAAIRVGYTRAPFVQTLSDGLRAGFGIGSATGSIAVLIALSTGVMGFWSLLIFCIPLLLLQVSFKRYASIRATYRQTIGALARVTEVGGYTENGHSRRVCDLSLTVGRELGMSEADLLDLEYAALMHDIGQISLKEPIPGGVTVTASWEAQRRIAELGATVIKETGVLDRVAAIVERQSDPYRRPGQQVDETLPLAARIIKVVNAFDDLVGGSADSGPRLDALERLRMGMAYDFDPRVVEVLTRVVDRNLLLSSV